MMIAPPAEAKKTQVSTVSTSISSSLPKACHGLSKKGFSTQQSNGLLFSLNFTKRLAFLEYPST